MKRTACGRWVHCACELWVPETALDAATGLVDGLQRIHKVCVHCVILPVMQVQDA